MTFVILLCGVESMYPRPALYVHIGRQAMENTVRGHLLSLSRTGIQQKQSVTQRSELTNSIGYTVKTPLC
jgi:hypothetical protein